MIKQSVKSRFGFTLIEILVVVIIGILGAIALPMYQKAVLKTRLTVYISQLLRHKQGYQEWKLVNGRSLNYDDFQPFFTTYLDNGRLRCLKNCTPNGGGSYLCYFPDGRSIQVNGQIWSPGGLDALYFYFTSVLGKNQISWFIFIYAQELWGTATAACLHSIGRSKILYM